jgi:4-amino-4-deoxy-L-arabinose transferase-like glycosyltransferase
MTYGIGRRLFDPQTGLFASIILATNMMFCVAARAATPDSLLIFFTTLAIGLYVLGTFSGNRGRSDQLQLRRSGQWFPQDSWLVVAMYAAMGFAVLAKGPVGAVLPTAIVGMFLLIMRLPRLSEAFWSRQGWFSRTLVSCCRPFHPIHFIKTCWSMRPLTAIAVILIVAAPWYVLVGLRTDWDFPRIFLFRENFGRALNTFESHGGGVWYYPLAILIGFFPWAVFLGPTILTTDRELSRQARGDGETPNANRVALIFLCCWIGVQVGLFSFARTKLPSYVTPCYPALAMWTAFALFEWVRGGKRASSGWITSSFVCLAFSGLLIALGLGIAGSKYLESAWWLALIGLIALFGGIAGIGFTRRERRIASLVTTGVTAALFCIIIFGFGTVVVDSENKTRTVLDSIRMTAGDQPVAAYRCLESSWVYYGKSPIYELSRQAKTVEPAATLHRDHFWKPKPRISPNEFVDQYPRALIITTEEHLSELTALAAAEFETIESAKLFLKDTNLLLIRPKLAPRQTASDSESGAIQKTVR